MDVQRNVSEAGCLRPLDQWQTSSKCPNYVETLVAGNVDRSSFRKAGSEAI
jgi:hypothetical protein